MYGSMEGQLLLSDEFDPIKMAIINISKWIDEERPYFEFMEKYDDIAVDRFVDPDEEASTDFMLNFQFKF